MKKNTKKNIAALLAFVIGGTAYSISGMVTAAGEVGQNSQFEEGEGYVSSGESGENISSEPNENFQDTENAGSQEGTEEEAAESATDIVDENADIDGAEAVWDSEENTEPDSGENPDRVDSDCEKEEIEESADTENAVTENESRDIGESKEENPDSEISQGTEGKKDQEKQEEVASTEPEQKTEELEKEPLRGELSEDNGVSGKNRESTAEEKDAGSLEGFGSDMENLETGSVTQEATGESLEEAKAGLQMPKQVTVIIDPWEIEARGQVYSEPYLIQNLGNAPILLVLKETIYSLRGDETFIRTDAEGLHEREEKSVYVQMNFDNGDQIVLTEEGVEYGIILEPGTGLQFWFSGEANENAVQPWGDGEVEIEMTYSWSTAEIMVADEPEKMEMYPDESEKLKENTDMEGGAGIDSGALGISDGKTEETEETVQTPDEKDGIAENADGVMDSNNDESKEDEGNKEENENKNEKESSESGDVNGENSPETPDNAEKSEEEKQLDTPNSTDEEQQDISTDSQKDSNVIQEGNGSEER